MTTQLVNREGSSEQWTADVIHGGKFAARLSVSTTDGVQLVRLRKMVDGEATGEVIGEQRSDKGRPLGNDAIEGLVSAWLALAAETIANERIEEMLDEINEAGDDYFEAAYSWAEYDGPATAARFAETDAAYVLIDGTVIEYDEPEHAFVARRDWDEMDRTEHPITHRAGGWHRQRIDAHSAATSTIEEHEIVWRTQRVRCCGRDLSVASGDCAPVNIDGSYGEIRGEVTQCPNCGSLYAAHFVDNGGAA